MRYIRRAANQEILNFVCDAATLCRATFSCKIFVITPLRFDRRYADAMMPCRYACCYAIAARRRCLFAFRDTPRRAIQDMLLMSCDTERIAAEICFVIVCYYAAAAFASSSLRHYATDDAARCRRLPLRCCRLCYAVMHGRVRVIVCAAADAPLI